MKTILLLLSLLFFISDEQEYIYQNLGGFNYNFTPNTNVGLQAYVTKQVNYNKNYNYANVFILKMRSTSHNNGILTSTWVYNAKIFINGIEVTKSTNPNGITLYIRTTETIVYSWYTDADDLAYGITWDDAIYDPRNIK